MDQCTDQICTVDCTSSAVCCRWTAGLENGPRTCRRLQHGGIVWSLYTFQWNYTSGVIYRCSVAPVRCRYTTPTCPLEKATSTTNILSLACSLDSVFFRFRSRFHFMCLSVTGPISPMFRISFGREQCSFNL